MMNFENILRMTQKKLYKAIKREYSALHEKGAWLLVKGEAPVLLVAHLDTVHREPVRDICKTQDGNILMSPQGIGGDDRCGVYALLSVYEAAKVKPWLLFTCDEEIGGVGASFFAEAVEWNEVPEDLYKVKCIIEIDRKGSDDAVYYDCGNKDFEDYVTSQVFKTDCGSYSDICDIAPALKVAAVNRSSGYYNAHTQHEYINLVELNATIARVSAIVEEACSESFPQYKFIERPRVEDTIIGNYYDWRDMYKPIDKIPERYLQMYEELQEIYSVEELDDIRLSYGDGIIQELYDAEFMGVKKDDDKAI